MLITCRQRHIRCDEQKPDCQNCTKTGRKCDGYDRTVSQKQLHQNVLLSYDRSRTCNPDSRLILLEGTGQEREYIALFCTQTSQALTGFFTSDFWNRLLPQLSHSEPIVRHAVAAVGAAYQRYQGIAVGSERTENFMLQQYNQAIRLLMKHLSAPTNEQFDLTLITCGLFMCLEMFRGDHNRVLDHTEAGLEILERAITGSQFQSQSQSQTADQQKVREELSELFFRFNMELLMFARRSKLLSIFTDPKCLQVPATFKSISDARKYSTSIGNYTITAFMKSGAFSRQSYQQDEGKKWIRSQLPIMEAAYNAWLVSFERLLQTKQGKSADKRAVLVLRIDFLTLVTWSLGIIQGQGKETDKDKWNGHYAEMLTLVEQLLHLEAHSSAERYFSLDHVVVRALQWIATCCREPVTRHRAFDLLVGNQRQENLWNSRRSAKIAEYLINSEEGSLLSLPVEQRVPPEHERVAALVFWDDAVPGKTWLRTMKHGPQGQMQVSMELIDWSQ
ncbi:hypothetical protein N7474_009274 [Penicillium riverlandense]|uniref:uncharacterized protein n=1 Tax=Penicillium riverlandense TaxID=1903569 RepID=UPI00254817CD|nr:uncharacterized protein N7474_009274 [Penicillium riverlandense]KAJ5808005.1 hypothetical protein N7474_009274 [Penicillium riverlandense]